MIPKAQAAGVRFLLGDDYGAIGFAARQVRRRAEAVRGARRRHTPRRDRLGAPATAPSSCAGRTTSARSRSASWPTCSSSTATRAPTSARSPTPGRSPCSRAAQCCADPSTTCAARHGRSPSPSPTPTRGRGRRRSRHDDGHPRRRAGLRVPADGHRDPRGGRQPAVLRALLLHLLADDQRLHALVGVGHRRGRRPGVRDGPQRPRRDRRHHIIGILLFGEDGKLAGERIYASDELLRFFFGPLLDQAVPVDGG